MTDLSLTPGAQSPAPAASGPSSPCGPTAASPTPRPEAVTLRRATEGDAEALALIGAATFLEAFTWMLPGADIIAHCRKNHTPEAYRAYLAQPRTRIMLAEAAPGGAPVGYAMLTEPELPSIVTHPTDIELKRIYLFSRFRSAETPVIRLSADREPEAIPGLRAGQALMDAAVADARALGCTRLLLGTHAGNLQAIDFYRKNGFSEAGTRTFQVGTQICCDLIFAKAL